MTKKLFFPLFFLFAVRLFAVPHAWINEFHYDNAGTDQNEFVEVIVEDPDNWYLGDLVLYMYNGYDGVQYCLDSISEFTLGDRVNDFQLYTWHHRGIQNDTEGMILVFKDTLVDILAYEGSFTGTNSPANGTLFPDIGVKETGSGPDTCAIYLTGMPGTDWDYGVATPGKLNPGQSLSEEATPVILNTFNATDVEGCVHLNWETASETETQAFQLFRDGKIIATVSGQGHSTSTTTYSYIDHDVSANETYEYSLKEIHFSGKATLLHTLKIHTHCPRDFGLGIPFPNPANPESTIELVLFKNTHLKIEIYDLKGRMIREVIDKEMNHGKHTIKLNLFDLSSGKYIIQCNTPDQVESFDIILLK